MNKPCLEIVKKIFGEKNRYVATSLHGIGNVYGKKHEYDKALEYYFKSLEIRKELFGEKHYDIAASYSNIGIIYNQQSKYNKALEYHFIGLEMKKELFGEKHVDVADTYDNIGLVYANKLEYSKALEYYYKSLEIKKELLDDKNIAMVGSYNNIGNVYRDLENEKALKYYHLAVASNLKNFNDTANITKAPVIKNYINYKYLLSNLKAKAKIFTDTNFQNNSISYELSYFESLKLALRHYQAADTLISLARKDISTKSDKLALGEQASEIYKGAINVCLDLTGFENLSGLDYAELAFYFSEKNKSSVLLEALAGSEALNFAGIPDNLLELEHKLSIDIANYKNLKNNAENDSLANDWNSRLFNTQRSYDSLIVVFETQYPDYYNLKYNNSPATVKEISNLLDKKTAMLSYFVGDSTITIFAISKKDFIIKEVSIVETLHATSLHEAISDYRFVISETDLFEEEIFDGTHYSVDEYEELAFQLYNLLFPSEIQEFLKGGLFYDIENLIIIPDGQLATIPFETLFTEKYKGDWTDWSSKTYFAEMPYLIKDYNISYSYSATLFQQTKPKQKSDKVEITPLNDWIAFAPVFDDENTAGTTIQTRDLFTFETTQNDSIVSRSYLADGRYVSPLPGSKTEIETIFDLYEQQGKKALIKTHQEADENFIKSGELQNYKILHFATHGFVNESEPELSGILFAQDTTVTNLSGFENLTGLIAQQNEGILYQSEIYNLNFNADLVVLSACQTGLGKITKGEGVIGLTRALLYAGTNNIIVSLWSVNDNSTSKLMIDFYDNLLSEKPVRSSRLEKFSKHLSKAKRKMIDEGQYSHPYYWSPFILIGE